MISEQVFILFTGSAAILFIIWYFFGKNEPTAVVADDQVFVKVDAGYSPSTIIVKKGQAVTLKFTRTHPSSCFEQIIIPEWKINKMLPLDKTIDIVIKPQTKGNFPFSCGMNMSHGRIVVTD